MANVLTMVKNAVAGGDDVADLVAQIDAARAKGVAAHQELERLEQVRLSAETFEAAEAANARIARVTWEADRLAAMIPELESRLAIARAAKNRKVLAKHQDIARKILPRLVAAVTNAADIQHAAIEARQAAIAELGESAVSVHIEPIAYLGILTREFVTTWAHSMEKRLAAPQSAPAAVVAPRIASTPARPAGVADRRVVEKPVAPAATPTPAPKPKRQPRRDKVAPNGRLVQMLRSGVDVAGFQSMTGDVIAMSAADAERLVMSGAGEFVNT
jgi:hypothetical protein